MTRYTATIHHHSIARARVVDVGDNLLAAKRAATREFGGDQNDYTICIYDRDYRDGCEPVASRRMDLPGWSQLI